MRARVGGSLEIDVGFGIEMVTIPFAVSMGVTMVSILSPHSCEDGPSLDWQSCPSRRLLGMKERRSESGIGIMFAHVLGMRTNNRCISKSRSSDGSAHLNGERKTPVN